MHLVGFVIRIYHDARSPKCQKSLLILLFKILQRHVSALRSHIQAENKSVCVYIHLCIRVYVYISIYIFIYIYSG